MSICHTEQLYTDAALVLDASTRVVASAGKWPDRSALALRSIAESTMQTRRVAGCINRAHDRVCMMCICDAEQLYTDAALVLDAFTRVAAAAGKRPHRSVH